jgi:hypothetical protein
MNRLPIGKRPRTINFLQQTTQEIYESIEPTRSNTYAYILNIQGTQYSPNHLAFFSIK